MYRNGSSLRSATSGPTITHPSQRHPESVWSLWNGEPSLGSPVERPHRRGTCRHDYPVICGVRPDAQCERGVQADSALDLDNLWEFTLTLPTLTYPSSDLQSTFFHALDERMASAQFLESAALASAPPFNSRDSRGVVIDGDRIPESTSVPQTQVVV